jgi:glycosyltransferase involved in cell wall biosynthesis
MKRIKILHVIPSLNPLLGGTVECVRQVASCIESKGYEIEVLCLDNPASAWLSRHKFPIHALNGGVLKYAFSPTLVLWLWRNAPRYDVIVVNGIWQFHAFATWLVSCFKSFPYVVYAHGMLTEYSLIWKRSKWPKKYLYWHLVERRVLARAASVIFTSQEEQLSSTHSLPGTKTLNGFVVGNGIAAPNPEKEVKSLNGKTSSGSIPQRPYLLFLGRLHPVKGLDIALHAIAASTKDRSDYSLVVAGTGERTHESKMHQLCDDLKLNDCVIWTGEVAGGTKWDLLAGASALLLPSHHENFGLVVAEALSVGTPVLITKKVAIWREVAEAGAGIVSDDNFESFSASLRHWLNMSAEEKVHMRRRANQCYESEFKIENVVIRLLAKLEEIAVNAKYKGIKGTF